MIFYDCEPLENRVGGTDHPWKLLIEKDKVHRDPMENLAINEVEQCDWSFTVAKDEINVEGNKRKKNPSLP